MESHVDIILLSHIAYTYEYGIRVKVIDQAQPIWLLFAQQGKLSFILLLSPLSIQESSHYLSSTIITHFLIIFQIFDINLQNKGNNKICL